MNNHGLSPIVRLFYQAAAALQLETSEKLQRIVIAVSQSPEHSEGKAKQSRLYINQQIKDCHVAYAPRNDTPKRFFQWSQLAPKFRAARLWRGLLVIGIVATCLLSHTTTAHAFGPTQCAASRNGSDVNCNAGDVSITNIQVIGDVTSCTGGTNVTLDLEVTVNFDVPTRYDIGIFISSDGKSPQYLPPTGAASCSVAILPNSSPFLNKDGPTDTCGDGNRNEIGGGTGSGILYMPGVTVPCQALSGSNGKLYTPFVVSWDQNKTPPGAVCSSINDPFPDAPSKCNASNIDQGTGIINVVVMPTITKTDGIGVEFKNSGDTTTYTVVITNTTGVTLSGAVFKDPAVTNIDVTSDPIICSANGTTCPADLAKASMQGAGITIPDMPANSSVTFTITATLTGTPPDTLTNTASVTVGGQTKTASDTDRIVGTIAIIPTSISQYGTQGASVIYNYTLHNFGGSSDTISLLAGSNKGWPTQLSSSSITVAAGGSANFTLTVQIPAGATIGTIDTTTITATSGNNPSKTATAAAVTTVSGPLTLTPCTISNPCEGAGGKSSSVFYDHRVQNNTASSQTVTFSTTVPGSCIGWTAVPPSNVTLAPFGGYQDVTVRVNIPATVAINDTCTVTVTATDSSGNSASTADKTTVKGIVLYSNPAYTDESYIFPAGNRVYGKAFGADATKYYRFYWYDSSNVLQSTFEPTLGMTLSDDYDIPATGLFGTWRVEVWRLNASGGNPVALHVQTNFYVGPDHLNATYTFTGMNPSMGSNVTIPITLHDRYSTPHVVPLDPSTGNVVSGSLTTKDPLKITVTVSTLEHPSSAMITEYCNPTCTAITPAQTVTFNLPATGATKGTATITITDSAKETVWITPDTYDYALYGSSITPPPGRDEPATVTFVRRRMRILDWREVQ
ncbi:MAG: hypothetical protein WC855_14590 [Thermodesulfovibrionales bacterium]